MTKKFILSLSAIALLLSGCGDNPKISPHKETVKQTTSKDPTPSWVYAPSKLNQICEIGSAINNSQAKTKALFQAKANIAKEIKVYINTNSTKSIKCTTKECETQYKVFSNHQSGQMLNDIAITDRYIDNNTNRYYLRACTPINDDIFQYKKELNNIAKSLQTTKKSCIAQSAYPNKNLSQLKKMLVNTAKQNSLEELYGTLIFSSTDIVNGKLSSNEIRSRAVGSVRVKGNPIFYNGENLGEICANITSYITKEDIEKYSPKKVKLKHFCYVNSNMPLKKIKENAKYKAYITSISKYKPSLKNISKIQATKLIHGFEISNDTFDFSSGAYCFDSVATLMPYELEMRNIKVSSNNNDDLPSYDDKALQSGLMATFYKDNDYNLKHPIYKTYVSTLTLSYKKLPKVSVIKENTPYRIKFTGFIKSTSDKKVNLKLYEEVYEASLFINDRKILSRHKKQNSVTLKKGFNKIKFIIKTANSYDVKIVGDIEDIYTNKIK